MSQLRLTGTGGGNTILNGNDTITADQTFEFPDNGGTLLTGSQTETGSGGSSGSAQVVGYQQGKWTPVAETGTITPSATGCWWVRIGNIVTLNGDMSAFSDTSGADPIRIKGAPYDFSDQWNIPIGAARFHQVTYPAGAATHSLVGASGVYFTSQTSNAQAQMLRHSEINNDSTSRIIFQVTYVVTDTTWAPGNSATVS